MTLVLSFCQRNQVVSIDKIMPLENRIDDLERITVVATSFLLQKAHNQFRIFREFCKYQRTHGFPAPVFDRNGSIVNQPPPLGSSPKSPQFHSRPGYDYQRPINGMHFQQAWDNNSFALSFTLPCDQFSPAHQAFDQFRNHPCLPNHLIPRKVIFMYDRPTNQMPPKTVQLVRNPYYQPPAVQLREMMKGNFNVVRYNAKAQTEWREHSADNSHRLHKAVLLSGEKAPTPTPNCKLDRKEWSTKSKMISELIQPEMAAHQRSIAKVAKWLEEMDELTQKPYEAIETTHPTVGEFLEANPSASIYIEVHGSQSPRRNLKNLAVPLSPNVKHISLVLGTKVERARSGGVDVDGDHHDSSNSKKKIEEKMETKTEERKENETGLKGDSENNACLVGQESSGAERCSESNGSQTSGFNDAQFSHDDVESQAGMLHFWESGVLGSQPENLAIGKEEVFSRFLIVNLIAFTCAPKFEDPLLRVSVSLLASSRVKIPCQFHIYVKKTNDRGIDVLQKNKNNNTPYVH
ncbi:Protein CBG15547 [Caenorhabditis briggsae]|uniref:Protein CBG15547 n=1 Tax=Caenorhabditis briggsae TaxID=6238 RepID=A8XM52_CAEBR|nr:Protein CBG15547 [Caenorhabditis briggsae]CAP33727.1 Protein CBG15547 [Caenorhabditis briggsae]